MDWLRKTVCGAEDQEKKPPPPPHKPSVDPPSRKPSEIESTKAIVTAPKEDSSSPKKNALGGNAAATKPANKAAETKFLRGYVGNTGALGAGAMAHVSIFLDFSDLLKRERDRTQNSGGGKSGKPSDPAPTSIRRFLYAVKQYPQHNRFSKCAAKAERDFFWKAKDDIAKVPFLNRASIACRIAGNFLIAFPFCMGGDVLHAVKRRMTTAGNDYAFRPSPFPPQPLLQALRQADKEKLEQQQQEEGGRKDNDEVGKASVDLRSFHTKETYPTSNGEEWSFSPSGLPFAFVAQTAYELLLAVDGLYESGWSHNDIKPDNIFIDHTGHIALGDFGLASAVGMDPYDVLEGRCFRGGANLPPPPLCGGVVDLFSCGITLLWMALGVLPSMDPDTGRVFIRHDLVSCETADPEDACHSGAKVCADDRRVVWALFTDFISECVKCHPSAVPPSGEDEEEDSQQRGGGDPNNNDDDDDQNDPTSSTTSVAKAKAIAKEMQKSDAKATAANSKDSRSRDSLGEPINTPKTMKAHRFFAHPAVARMVGVESQRRESLKRHFDNDETRPDRLKRLFTEIVAERRLRPLHCMNPAKMCDPSTVLGFAKHDLAVDYLKRADVDNFDEDVKNDIDNANANAASAANDTAAQQFAQDDDLLPQEETAKKIMTEVAPPPFYPCDLRFFMCQEWDLSKWTAEDNAAALHAKSDEAQRRFNPCTFNPYSATSGNSQSSADQNSVAWTTHFNGADNDIAMTRNPDVTMCLCSRVVLATGDDRMPRSRTRNRPGRPRTGRGGTANSAGGTAAESNTSGVSAVSSAADVPPPVRVDPSASGGGSSSEAATAAQGRVSPLSPHQQRKTTTFTTTLTRAPPPKRGEGSLYGSFASPASSEVSPGTDVRRFPPAMPDEESHPSQAQPPKAVVHVDPADGEAKEGNEEERGAEEHRKADEEASQQKPVENGEEERQTSHSERRDDQEGKGPKGGKEEEDVDDGPWKDQAETEDAAAVPFDDYHSPADQKPGPAKKDADDLPTAEPAEASSGENEGKGEEANDDDGN